MKVVFLQDVPNVAKAGEVKEVSAGYGRNYLIPKKLAVLASPQAMSQVETSQKAQARTEKEMAGIAGQLDGKEVNLKARAGAKEKLYGAITSADIAAELERATGLVVDKRKIELAEPIHHLGNYEVTIHLGKDITPKIKVSVTEEEAPPEEEKPKKAKKATKKAAKAEKAAETAEAEEKAPKKKPAAKKATAKKETKATKEKKPAKKKEAATEKKKTTKAKKTEKKEETA